MDGITPIYNSITPIYIKEKTNGCLRQTPTPFKHFPADFIYIPIYCMKVFNILSLSS